MNGNSRGSDGADVIDLDDDDDDESTVKPVEAQFEDEEEEVDPSQPYHKILRYIDINLSTDVLHLSSPSIPSDLSEASPGAYPEIFSTHIITTIACSDSCVRVITLPLRPPAPENKDSSNWGLNIIKLGGTEWLSELFSSVSVTHHGEGFDDTTRSRSRSRRPTTSTTTKRAWFFLVASASDSAGGILFIHQIPIGESAANIKQSTLQPIQQEFLNAGLGSKLMFNPSAYPATHYSDLLIAHPSGSAKLYRCLSDQAKRLSASRRGSNATTDSLTSTGKLGHPGKFLMAFSCDFDQRTSNAAKRECILDASWVFGGRAILVLLEGGRWGIWDIEGTDPVQDLTPRNLWQKPNNRGLPSASKGASITFSLQGHIANKQETRHVQGKDVQELQADKFTAAANSGQETGRFFLKNAQTSTKALSLGSYTNGCISIVEHSSDNPSSSVPDESVLLNYGSQNISISSLLSLWRAQLSDKGTLDPSLSVRPTILPDVRIPSGRQVDVSHLAIPSKGKDRINRIGPVNIATQNLNTLLAFERRIILVVPPLEEHAIDETSKSLTSLGNENHEDEDLMLLDQGELDIDGVDRILDGMDRNNVRDAGGFGVSRGSGGIRA